MNIVQINGTIAALLLLISSASVFSASHEELSSLEAELLGSLENDSAAEPLNPLEQQILADDKTEAAAITEIKDDSINRPQLCTQANAGTDETSRESQPFILCGNSDTVMDKLTGLIWDRCAYGKIYNSATEKCEGDAEILNWQEALQLVQKANQDNYLGNNDWRLPNIKELPSIVKTSCAYPAIDTEFFPDTDSVDFWSSSVFEQFPARAWNVHFKLGQDYATDKRYYKQIRLVRVGKGYSSYDMVTGQAGDWTTACVMNPKFDFTPIKDVPLTTEIRSEQIEINFSGSAPREVSVENGEFEINSSGNWLSSPAMVNSGDRIMVRHTSSNSYLNEMSTVLKVGNTSGSFTSTTMQAIVPDYEEVVLDGPVLFEYKSAVLTSEARANIDNYLSQYRDKTNQIELIVVLGHTDSIASEQYNQKLSEERANSVSEYIRSIDFLQGITIQPVGMGEIEPVATNETEEGRQQNRRVVIRVEFK